MTKREVINATIDGARVVMAAVAKEGTGGMSRQNMENYGAAVAIVALADDLAEARALLERLDNAHAAESRQLLAEALEASRAFLELTR